MPLRQNDLDTKPGALRMPDQQPPVKITREIPLWGILTVVGGLLAQSVHMYYSNMHQGQKLDEVVTEFRAMTVEMHRSNVRYGQMEYQISDLQRRIAALEARK